ncbi:uncharacterized protein LOC123698661 [Colias croceus]|uniref:uncharacterized protein LOC123698661 n=1 Tax=Colias crocea TaxID=72248 RepID=UPI001E27FD27|nr:uncharacterized protein LOC123698661 [Colias croceus]
MSALLLKICLVLFICPLSYSSEINSTSIVDTEDLLSSKILSRRKRFLNFPDGSSFQLVICTQNHGYLQLGNIVWFANTAALAYELPTDPNFLLMFKGREKDLIQNRNGVSKNIYLLDEDGRVLKKLPYHKKFIVNPAFAKRSVNEMPQSNRLNAKLIKDIHTKQAVNHLENLDSSSIEFHREGRMALYEKLNGFLTALGYTGEECVLRMLCETGQGRNEQGTFFEEIMRATFTLPGKKDSEYDVAHTRKEDCGIMYPGCEMTH